MSGIIEERREGCKSQRNRKLKMKSSPRIPETTFKKSYQHDCRNISRRRITAVNMLRWKRESPQGLNLIKFLGKKTGKVFEITLPENIYRNEHKSSSVGKYLKITFLKID